MVEAVLQKEERFMLGDWFYEVGIVAYLQRQDLIRDQVSLTDSKNESVGRYFLNGGGEITLSYNSHFDLSQVTMSPEVSEEVAKNLRTIGEQSRRKK